MLKKVALILGLLLLMPAAQAQFIPVLEEKDMRNQQVLSGLVSAMDAGPNSNGLSSVRGTKGAAKNPLGQYLIAPNTEFKSIYREVPTDLQAKFAYDLHEFLKAKGRDWPAMQRNSNLDYVSYEKQNEFASFWWLRNYKPFKDLPFFFHDGFLNDALLDATNSYNWYARKDYASADYTAWGDVVLRQILNKK